jgi:tryptophan synthase beta chain
MVNGRGYHGDLGGCFVPEILVGVIEELADAFESVKQNENFLKTYDDILSTYSCRPTPLTFAANLTEYFGGPRIYVKREDLNHSGAHKLNNVIGQGLLAQYMGKTRVIAETGAGQHGVAVATMAAKFDLKCTIYMGDVDIRRQRPNVFWMEQLGAEVVSVRDGSGTLKDAINAALRDWSGSASHTHYVLGTACGPHPFPEMVMFFQSIIGRELKGAMLFQENRCPCRIYACAGGGSNALGAFGAFLDDDVELVAVEAGGLGKETGSHASRLAWGAGSVGVAQGYKTYFLQNPEGQMTLTHSVAAGLDYIGISPILASLWESGRVRCEAATDEDVVEAFRLTAKKEGLLPALESSHAFAQAFREVRQLASDDSIVIIMSGRGDKDIFTVADALDDAEWKRFIIEKGDSYRA